MEAVVDEINEISIGSGKNEASKEKSRKSEEDVEDKLLNVLDELNLENEEANQYCISGLESGLKGNSENGDALDMLMTTNKGDDQDEVLQCKSPDYADIDELEKE